MLGEVVRNRPEIALDDFLPIFLSSSLVLVFGALFVGIYTLVKMGYLKKFLYAFCISFLDTSSLLYVFYGYKTSSRRFCWESFIYHYDSLSYFTSSLLLFEQQSRRRV